MTKAEIFSVWADPESPWSRWVKPVLFAHVGLLETAAPLSAPAPLLATSSLHALPADTVLVIDLPGEMGVQAALSFAAKGFRPIPLYNALPVADDGRVEYAANTLAEVNVVPILRALVDGSQFLQSLKLPPNAPPAFILDSNRHGHGPSVVGRFDNRSVSFTTDFPSAGFLLEHDIRRIVLVQSLLYEPLYDLANSLRLWQDAGMKLERVRLDSLESPEPFTLSRLPKIAAWFKNTLSLLGLSRPPQDGFGRWISKGPSGG